MRWLGRILVFGVALSLGIASTFRAATDVPETILPVQPLTLDEEQEPAHAPTGIQVTYAGWEKPDDQGPVLKFMIYNGLFRPIVYSSQIRDYPFANILLNGKESRQVIGCGNGRKNFYILPGGSAEVLVPHFQFLEYVGKHDKVSVGFRLRPLLEDKYEAQYCQPFELPDEFRREVQANAKRIEAISYLAK